MLYLQNDLLEAVPLDRARVSIPGYLGKIKRGLKEKYKAALAASAEAPEFLVVALSGPVTEIDSEGPAI